MILLMLSWCEVGGMDLGRCKMPSRELEQLLEDIQSKIIPAILKETKKFPNVSLDLIVDYISRTQSEDIAQEYKLAFGEILKYTRLNNLDRVENLLTEDKQASPLINVYGGGMNGVTPLSYAISGNKRDIVELILREGADVNALDYSGQSPLMVASSAGNISLVNLLLAQKMLDINLMNPRFGRNALWSAVNAQSQNKNRIVELLLNEGANINQGDCDGNTVLFDVVGDYIRAKAGNELDSNVQDIEKILRLLLDRGANVVHKNNKGQDIEEYATSLHFEKGHEKTGVQIWREFLSKYLTERITLNEVLGKEASQLPQDLLNIIQGYAGLEQFSGIKKYLDNKKIDYALLSYGELAGRRLRQILTIVKDDPYLAQEIQKNRDAILKRLVDGAMTPGQKEGMSQDVYNYEIETLRFSFMSNFKGNQLEGIEDWTPKHIPELRDILLTRLKTRKAELILTDAMKKQIAQQSTPNSKTINGIVENFNKTARSGTFLSLPEIATSEPMLLNRMSAVQKEMREKAATAAAA